MVGRATAGTTSPPSDVSPFSSDDDEMMFWSVMNDEVDLMTTPRTPTMRLAITLRACLSEKTPAETRITLLQIMLSSKFTADLPNDAALDALIGAFQAGGLEVRILALKEVLNRDAKMANILRYVLNDTARMKDFMSKNSGHLPDSAHGKMEHNQ